MASIMQRGPVWRAMIRRKGQSLTATFDTKASAEAWAAREEARIMVGATAAQVKATPSSATVADLLQRYARDVSPKHDGAKQEQMMLDKLARMLPVPLATFDRAAAAKWRDDRLRMPAQRRKGALMGAGSVIREMSLMSHAFKIAKLEWGIIKENPWTDVEKPRSPEARDRRVSDDERAAIIKELGWDGVSTPDDLREWIAWSYCLALETMMRRGEILGMTWRHVHLDRRFVHLPKTKNRTKRDVPLSSAALALFKMIREGLPDAHVVHVCMHTFVAYFRIAVADAGVEVMHFHDTRHEAITRNARKFKTVLDLSRASGHKSMQSQMRYVETTAEEMAEHLG